VSFLDLHANSSAVNAALFAVAAALVWMAGTRLSRDAEAISRRTGLGEALTGLLLLATVTSLPELVTSVTATAIGSASLATNNLLGGVALQTVVLAVVDLVAVREALTARPAAVVLLVQGILLILLLAVALALGTMGEVVSVASVGAGSTLIFALFVASVVVTRRASHAEAWRVVQEVESERVRPEETTPAEERSRASVYGGFAVASLVVTVAGWMLARTGDVLAEQTGLGASLVGALLVATATSLPELSTTLTAARLGAYGMAIANVFGGNAYDVALLFPADLAYRRGPLLDALEPQTLFLGALGIVLTAVYVFGLLARSPRKWLRMGLDSWAVIGAYVAGMIAFSLVW
jgi:cation:H+ antiporter